MRKTLLALAAVASLSRSSSLARLCWSETMITATAAIRIRTLIPRPGGYRHWSGYVDAPVGEPISPCHWITQRFWDGHGWRERRVRICG